MKKTRIKKSRIKKLSFNNEQMIMNMSKYDQNEILNHFGIEYFGLTDEQFRDNLEKFGTNEIQKVNFNWFGEFVKSYFNAFNLILIAITFFNLFSYLTAQFSDWSFNPVWDASTSPFEIAGIVITSAMVLISGTISYIQVIKSFFSTKKISSIVKTTTNIIRHQNDEKLIEYKKVEKQNQLNLIKLGEEIDVKQLVPGDLVYLSSGDMVPADVRIILSTDLFINQSSLTGESLPVEKHAYNSNNTDNILDLENICYTGTSVVSGGAIAIVIATSNDTYFATISKTIMQKRPESSFTKGIKSVTRILLIFMLMMVPIIYIVASLTNNELKNDAISPWVGGLIFAAAVGVGLTPEMLPMIVNINLSRGSRRMAKNKVVVKELEAVQALGAIDILCTDKTGTLTNDKIDLVEYLSVDKKKDDKLIKLLYMNSYFQTGLRNPMDKAVLDYVTKNNFDFNKTDKFSKVDEIPFDFNRRKLTLVIDSEVEGRIMITKGSAEEIMNSSNRVFYKGKVVEINDELRRQIEAYFEKANEEGKRVLGIAYKPVEDNQTVFKVEDESELIFYGFASFLDTPKPSSAKMISLLKKYGVDLKILTGDNEPVTRAICKMVNLDITGLVTGSEIENASEQELKRIVEKNNIFVKLNPLQKVRIIQVLKSNGHSVGYMGDGINDAPVLRQSDVAISVQNATDIAKDASDIILLEKSLLVLEKGIIEGRMIFGNILKYAKITFSSNFGNALSMLLVAAFLPFLPMLPSQLLLQNLIYDFSQFVSVMDRVDDTFIQKPQKWNSKEFVPFALINGPVSSIFDIITFVIVGWGLGTVQAYNNNDASLLVGINPEIGVDAKDLAQSIFQGSWFIVGLISQTIIFHILRTEKLPFIKSRSPWPIFLIGGIIMLVAFLIPYIEPIGSIFRFAQPSLIYIPIVVGIISAYCLVAQTVKMLFIKIYKKWL
ncbi:magnesium-translocating P-type ATPase [Mesoplasma photuris]|uniref:magnesium-translocating P-type ATPase n=1 Tax=Mesoplasma photuris TaxID=217731 RepID=UPI0004E27974|nr:magnesium-translocating P-type ATPase [Mesoplasma photuris]